MFREKVQLGTIEARHTGNSRKEGKVDVAGEEEEEEEEFLCNYRCDCLLSREPVVNLALINCACSSAFNKTHNHKSRRRRRRRDT